MANDKIEHITYPYVFTELGRRHHVKELTGTPRVGSEIDEDLVVLTNIIDPNCIGSKCPIR